MKTLIASAVITLVFAAAARAQTDGIERLSITVQGATISSPGGEELRVGGGANPNEPGKTARHGFSLRPDRCTWAVSRVVEPDADLGWAVDITPLRVVDDAVTFRLACDRPGSPSRPALIVRNGLERRVALQQLVVKTQHVFAREHPRIVALVKSTNEGTGLFIGVTAGAFQKIRSKLIGSSRT